MTDLCDQANDLRDLELACALANRSLPPAGHGASECEECGNDIPAPRQALGYRICVTCAEVMERTGRSRR